MNNLEYLTKAVQREQASPSPAPQDFRKIDRIMTRHGMLDTTIHDLIMDLKVMRMKKIMIKYGTPLLSWKQASEIWGEAK